MTTVDRDRLLSTFLELVRIDSPSGHEETIARHLMARLQKMGLKVHRDVTGNVIGVLPGKGVPLLLNAHMDTVEPGRGVNPVVEEDIVCSDGTTVLGGDDKSGVAIILEVLQVVTAWESPPALEVVFTVGEEKGLRGSKGLDLAHLQAKEGVVLDCGGPIGTIVTAAPSLERIRAVVRGKAAHAGAEPEKGINAIRVAAEAIAAMPLGRIDAETTANIGYIEGGQATNIVPDRVEIRGEARSRDEAKLRAQIAAMRRALEEAAQCHGAQVDIEIVRSYTAFRLDERTRIVQRAVAAARTIGVEPRITASGGGFDANIFNAAGLPTIALSTGMQKVHTTEEYIRISDMVRSAEMLLALVGQKESHSTLSQKG